MAALTSRYQLRAGPSAHVVGPLVLIARPKPSTSLAGIDTAQHRHHYAARSLP